MINSKKWEKEEKNKTEQASKQHASTSRIEKENIINVPDSLEMDIEVANRTTIIEQLEKALKELDSVT